MKKIISIFITILALSSCYKTTIDKSELIPGFFHSECSIGDSLFYYMNCNVDYEYAKLQFIRKKVYTIDNIYFYFDNEEYAIYKDTLITLQENYIYNPNDFKYMLINKNKIKRDTSIFKITSNMYCTWECFDNIYNKYVTSK